MSEPMSSGEIEDVLSSIRRLVSEDLRPAAPKTTAPKTTDFKSGAPNVAAPRPAISESSGKLLLTPALRVVGGEPPSARPLVTPPAEAVQDAVEDQPEAPFGEDTKAYSTEGQAAEAEWDDSRADAPTRRVTATEAEDWLPEEAPMDTDHELSDWEAPVPEPAHRSDSAMELNRVVSEIGAAVADSADEWEPETGDLAVSTLSWKAPEWVEEADVVADSVEAAERDAVARALADKAEAAAVAEIMARAAAAKAEAEAQAAEKQGADSKAAPEADLFAEDEGYFDETVLRDLVRDLIREELSGTLGERITRNVRKLVRAEINRALTARDFD